MSRSKVDGLDILAKATSGATVKCQLLGSTDGKSWSNVGDPVEVSGKAPTVEFPQTTTYRFFKVQTTIDYTR